MATGEVKISPSWRYTVHESKERCWREAGKAGADLIRAALRERSHCNIVLATGASQFGMLEELVASADIDWTQVTCFHLDEYIGLGRSHPASFARYLQERFVDQLKVPPKTFHFVDGLADPETTCRELDTLIKSNPVDVAFIGFGENGHLAFNDPPADFATDKAYITVELDEACRQQQVGEGWFDGLDTVPKQAITMTIHQIMSAKNLIVTVPEERKAEAVYKALTQPVNPHLPASILQEHNQCYCFFDPQSASRLPKA